MIVLPIFFASIALGLSLGGVGIGFAGCMGVGVLMLCGYAPGALPLPLATTLLALTVGMAALDEAGGIRDLIRQVQKLLDACPRQLYWLAPLLSYFLTLVSGTGYLFFFMIPPLVAASKRQGIPTVKILPMAAVASQIAVVASPLSGFFLFLTGLVAPYHVTAMQLFLILCPSTLLGTLWTTRLLGRPTPVPLPVLQAESPQHGGEGRRALFIMGGCLLLMLLRPAQGSCASEAYALLLFFSGAGLIGGRLSALTKNNFFASGMNAVLCVLGMGWLGNTFFQHSLATLPLWLQQSFQQVPMFLAPLAGLLSAVLCSQCVTGQALLPAALGLGLTPRDIVSVVPALSLLFVLPNSPTTLATVEMNATGSTRLGSSLFTHPFLLPGVLSVALSLIGSFTLSRFLL